MRRTPVIGARTSPSEQCPSHVISTAPLSRSRYGVRSLDDGRAAGVRFLSAFCRLRCVVRRPNISIARRERNRCSVTWGWLDGDDGRRGRAARNENRRADRGSDRTNSSCSCCGGRPTPNRTSFLAHLLQFLNNASTARFSAWTARQQLSEAGDRHTE